jgi:hypothetical protein
MAAEDSEQRCGAAARIALQPLRTERLVPLQRWLALR